MIFQFLRNRNIEILLKLPTARMGVSYGLIIKMSEVNYHAKKDVRQRSIPDCMPRNQIEIGELSRVSPHLHFHTCFGFTRQQFYANLIHKQCCLLSVNVKRLEVLPQKGLSEENILFFKLLRIENRHFHQRNTEQVCLESFSEMERRCKSYVN